MEQALREWHVQSGGHGSTSDAVTWLQSEQPALLRAWMLAHLPELVERELGRLAPDEGHSAEDG
jgi:hypothetical protein